MCRKRDIWQRLLSQAIENPETKCLVWQGGDSGELGRGSGYGRISIDGHTSAVHRVAFTIFYGFLPGKSEVDHLCNNRLCFNPFHLERVTRKENCRRRDKKIVKLAPAISWRQFRVYIPNTSV